MFFSIAEGSVVQKWSRPSSSPNLVKQNVLHTHIHTHTPTHTHTHTSSSFSNTPIETHTHTHTMLKGAAKTIRNPLLKAGDKTPHGSQGSTTVFPPRQYCQVGGGQFPPHCRLRQRVASNQRGPAVLSHRQHPSLPPPPGSGSWGHKGL